MPDKGLRVADKVVPRLSASARREVCKVTSEFLQDVRAAIDRANKRGDFSQIRSLALEGEFTKRLRSNC